ncbi:Na/Pi cotransporter family protein [Maliponia aquimaris]|uniref:Na+/Pi-cotransporter n=1 Tax=Maliponia aquimaris TaxID=1673631 RepID=A0A238L4T0_9RHOB|nr:Na/Pi cotransporter family protein [Maliponia aquimaris]SMX50029.1 Na+/Pi-cotransporter [Maliponia aquimaris]
MILFAINLAASVALLLWSVRMVRVGVERAFLPQARQGLKRMSSGPLRAAAGGMLGAMVLQSGTAVALIASGFVASGVIATGAALALMLGAELGSALMAQVLVLPIGPASAVLLLAGILLYFNAKSLKWQQVGRILVGFGLILVSLRMIREATAPIAGNDLFLAVFAYLEGDRLSAFVLGALLSWAMHSSLAAVLTVAAFASAGIIAWPLAVVLVFGANLGGALIPYTLLRTASRPVRVVVTANLMVRSAFALLCLAVVALGGLQVPALGGAPQQDVVHLHALFGLAVLLIALPLRALPVRAAEALVPPTPKIFDTAVSALDPVALQDTRLALACAHRELTRMAETVQAMLLQVRTLFHHWDPDAVALIQRREDEVDRMHYELKLYVARLRTAGMSEAQSRKGLELVTVANGLEEAADRIAVNMLALARKMNQNAIAFSPDGLEDIERFHDQVAANAQLALGVLTTGDPADARQLVADKDEVRRVEQLLQERHLRRLQAQDTASVASTNAHQETLRLLKQINASFSYVAYPIIEEAGEMLDSRLAVRAAGGGGS